MSKIVPEKSDSDLSSSSSWSVIEESEDSTKGSLENIYIRNDIDSIHSNNESQPEIENTFVNIPDQSERIVEDVNTTDASAKSNNKYSKSKRRKGRNKRQAEALSIITIIASVLTITGISLLCMLFPQNIEKKSFDAVQKNYMDLVINDKPSFQNSLNTTSEVLSTIHEADFFKNIQESLADEDVCPVTDEFDDTSNEDVFGPSYSPVDTSEVAEDQLTDRNIKNATAAMMNGLKKVLESPYLHVVLCTVMQDICLIKLFKLLNKNVTYAQAADKDQVCTCFDNKKRKNDRKANKIKISKILKRKLTEKKIKNMQKELVGINSFIPASTKPAEIQDNIPQQTLPPLFQDSTNDNKSLIIIKPVNVSEFHPKNVIAECQKKFEQLDNKWKSIGDRHHQNIEDIKERYKTEMNTVRETEKESALRTQKIKLIRDKYVERLRYDREKYFHELRKIKDERQIIMKTTCKTKKSLDSRDVSVGDYTVIIPGTYDFHQRLRLLKAKENTSKLGPQPASPPKQNANEIANSLNNESVSNVTEESENENVNNEQIKKKYYQERLHEYYNCTNRYGTNKNAHNDMYYNELTCTDSEIKYMRRVEPSIGSVEPVEENNTSNSTCKMLNEPNNSDVYELAFERKGQQIKKTDSAKWYHEKMRIAPNKWKLLSKADPQKSHKEKIIFKGQQ